MRPLLRAAERTDTAYAYKGLTIQFRGDTTDLSRKLSSLRRGSSEVGRELRAIDRALELDHGNVGLLGQRARYSAQQANILQERLDLMNAALAGGEVERGYQTFRAGAFGCQPFVRM